MFNGATKILRPFRLIVESVFDIDLTDDECRYEGRHISGGEGQIYVGRPVGRLFASTWKCLECGRRYHGESLD